MDIKSEIYNLTHFSAQYCQNDRMPEQIEYRNLFKYLDKLDKKGWLQDRVLKYAYLLAQYHNRDLSDAMTRDGMILECLRFRNHYERL